MEIIIEGQVWTKFVSSPSRQPIASIERLIYIVRRPGFIIRCMVPILTDYTSSIVACACLFNDFVDRASRIGISVFSLIDFGCICLALRGSLTSVVVLLDFLLLLMIIDSFRTIWVRSLCNTVNQNDNEDSAIVDEE